MLWRSHDLHTYTICFPYHLCSCLGSGSGSKPSCHLHMRGHTIFAWLLWLGLLWAPIVYRLGSLELPWAPWLTLGTSWTTSSVFRVALAVFVSTRFTRCSPRCAKWWRHLRCAYTCWYMSTQLTNKGQSVIMSFSFLKTHISLDFYRFP